MTIKNLFNTYFNQHIIAFHSGAIGGLANGANHVHRSRSSGTTPGRGTKIMIAIPTDGNHQPKMGHVAYAYRSFKKAGYTVDFVTKDGSPATFSQSDLRDPINQWFAEDAGAQHDAYHAKRADEVMPERYSAIFFAGASGSAFDDEIYRELSEQVLSQNGVVAGLGRTDEADRALNLEELASTGYSLPTYASVVSEYGSVAMQNDSKCDSWMVHKKEWINTDEDGAYNVGNQIVKLLDH